MSGAFAQNINEEFPLGPCKVIFNSNNLGHTDESTKVSVKATIVQALAAKYGKSGVGYFLNGQEAEVDCVLMQNDMTILAAAFPFTTQVTSAAGASKITLGVIAGQAIPSYTLTLIPENGITNIPGINVNWTMLAAPVGDFEPVYDGGKIAGYKVKFKSVINEAGAVSGAYLGTFGDTTISGTVAELTATVVPTEAASGVTGKTITWTFSQSLTPNTVYSGITIPGQSGTSNTITVIENAATAPVNVPGTVVLTNAIASTTVVWTRTAGNFTASQTWCAIASGAITDINGNALELGVGLTTYFQT